MDLTAKKIALLLILLALTACSSVTAQRQPQPEPPPSSSGDPAPEVERPVYDFGLDDYLEPLLNWESHEDLEVTLVRDDVGLRIPAPPINYEKLAKCLLEMELVPFVSGGNTLDIPHPFTMLFETGGGVETISFTNEKITLSGEEYSPAKPEALDAYYERDHGRFLSGKIYQLQTEMPFTDFDIASVRLEEHENYSSGVTVVDSTDPDDISRIMRALNQVVARRFERGEEPGLFEGVGGNRYVCAFTMRDGSTWSIDPRGTATVTPQSGIPEDILVFSLNYNDAFGLLLDKNAAIPQLSADIGGVSPTVYEIAYQSEKTQKCRTDVVPVAMHYDSDEILPRGGSYACSLVWSEGQYTPESVTATLYRETDDSVDIVDNGTPLSVKGGEMTLPAGEGKQYVKVRAQFAGGIWTEHVFAYSSSIIE